MVDRSTRILIIHDALQKGKIIHIDDLALKMHSCKRTIHRDINTLRSYYANRVCWDGQYQMIVYDKANNGYKLSN